MWSSSKQDAEGVSHPATVSLLKKANWYEPTLLQPRQPSGVPCREREPMKTTNTTPMPQVCSAGMEQNQPTPW